MRQHEKHIKHERRQQDLIMEFVRLGLHFRALLDQWGGLHSLSGMRKKSTSISYKKGVLYLHTEKLLKMQNSDGEMDSAITFMASRNAETI